MTTVSLDHDDAGGGPPVVLVHGHPFDRSMWQPQLRSLAGRFRLVAPDLRGYGASASTPGIVSMSTLAGDVWSLLDDLGIETAAVVGRDGWSTAEVTGELVDCLSDPRVLTLPGVGHLPNLERPDEFNAVLADFLDAARAARA